MTVHRINLHARAAQDFAFSGTTVLVVGEDGQLNSGSEGLYVDFTRVLSCADVCVGNGTVEPIVASAVDTDGWLGYARICCDGGRAKVFVERSRLVGGGMRERIRFTNHALERRAHLDVRLNLAADFADLHEVERGEITTIAPVSTTWDEDARAVRFRSEHPQLDRAVTITVDEVPGKSVRWDGRALCFAFELAPHGSADVRFSVVPTFDGVARPLPRTTFDAPPATKLEALRRKLRRDAPRLFTTNPILAMTWSVAVQDICSLALGAEPGPATPGAGVPGYQSLFGRDSLMIAWEAAIASSTMMRDVLRTMAAWQGTRIDDWRDEEPGKLLHQLDAGPAAVVGKTPFARYYGDYSAPQQFLVTLGEYLAWTGDLETVRELLPAARRAIEWLERYGDRDGDGLLEYETRSPVGLENQGWKDSGDAIVYEDGRIVPRPLGTAELQGYWYAGLQHAAVTFFLAGDRTYGLSLLARAERLKRRFHEAYWIEDLGFYALALDPEKRQVRSIASNAGHLLTTGIAPARYGVRTARRLMEPDMFSGWGIRTLSSRHPAFDPFSYHLGSVWPVENGVFAMGFARYGCIDELHRLVEGMTSAIDLFARGRMPEVIGGVPRDSDHPHPGLYPRSNPVQGWSASGMLFMVEALLGLRPLAPLGLLLLDPHLPPWIPDLRLEGVRVGRSRLDLDFRRRPSGRTSIRVTRREGRVRVLRMPSPLHRSLFAAPGAGA